MRPSTRTSLLLMLTLAGCAAMYWAGLYGPFLFDDFPNLAALDSIDRVGSWRDLGIYLSQPRSLPGRPVAMLSFLMQKPSWPDDPFAFKLVNLCIHLANGVLVFLLTRRLAGVFLVDKGRADRHSATAPALLTTAAWLICPIQLSAVLLVVQRMTLLMALFVLLGLLAYLKAVLADQASVRHRAILMTLGLGICTVLAFLSKENGILLPLYALVLDISILRTKVKRLPTTLGWLRRVLVYPAILFVIWYLLAQIPNAIRADSFRDFTLTQRLLTEPRVLVDYLAKTFVPRFGLYGIYNDDFAKSTGLLSPISTSLSLGLLALAVGVAFYWRKRHPLLALAVFWYLGGQIIESSVVMLELYFEHRNYLPVVGPFIALAIATITIQPPMRKLVYALATVWLGASIIATSLSASVWSSEQRLAFTWGSTHPDSIRAQTMLAGQFYKRGQLAKAGDIIDRALERHPGEAGLAENKMLLRCADGSLTSADLEHLRRTLRDAPWSRNGFENLKAMRRLAQQNRCPPLTTEWWEALASTLLANPAYQQGIAAGFIHYQLSEVGVYKGDLNQAIKELHLAYVHDPDAEIPRLQAKYLASAGLYEPAIAVLDHADYKRLPLLRRLLVDDHEINREMAVAIREKQASDRAASGSKPARKQTTTH